ncbi:MAG: hypothetical protein ACSHYA_13170 [Opitutaceae bacterium]
MDREQAKSILQLIRPGVDEDLEDPLIIEAFELMEGDSELQIWFEDQQEFDAQFCEHMNTIQPPADLKASILAGMRAHQIDSAPEPDTTPEPDTRPEPIFEATTPVVDFEPAVTEEPIKQAETPVTTQTNSAWWRNPWVGIAALFVFMLVIIQAPNRDDAQLAQNDPALSGLPPVLPFLADQIDGMNLFSFDKKDKSANELQSYLTSTGAPSPKNLCSELASTPTLGCVTFDFNNTKLSMICFKDGEVYHLITAAAADFPEACPKAPKVYEINNKAFKVWVDGDQLNILTIQGTKKDIPEFI